jgi:hypothetical protein
MAKLHDFQLDENDEACSVRCALKQTNKKKKKMCDPKPQFNHGAQVPKTIKQAIEFDTADGNALWQDSIKLEIKALTDLDCFDFKDPDHKCGPEHQRTTLTVMFGVKQDLRHKARPVAGGHLVDSLDHDICSSTVKGASAKLLHVIAHKTGMTQLCGNVGNAYVDAFTNKKVHAVAGKEFGEASSLSRKHCVVCVPPLNVGARILHILFAELDSLRLSATTMFGSDVWIRRLDPTQRRWRLLRSHMHARRRFYDRGKGSPSYIVDMTQSIYAVKSIGPPDCHLGNNHKKDKEGQWCIVHRMQETSDGSNQES